MRTWLYLVATLAAILYSCNAAPAQNHDETIVEADQIIGDDAAQHPLLDRKRRQASAGGLAGAGLANAAFSRNIKKYRRFDLTVEPVLKINGIRRPQVVGDEAMPDTAMNYLYDFGYIPMPSNSDGMSGSLMGPEMIEEALMNFQAMAHIEQTGVYDAATEEMMKKPRCGYPDNKMAGNIMMNKRRKRFALAGSMWGTNDITYRIQNYTPDMSPDQVRRELERAFQVWADYTPLTFREDEQSDSAIIQILFGEGVHSSDSFDNPFDGRGGVLAHAYFPTTHRIGGDAHFDDGERYTAFSFDGTNLFQVAAHEFGHSLGLGHSEVSGALMAPFYPGYIPNFELPSDDIDGIQAIYGIRATTTTRRPDVTPTTTRTTTTTTRTTTTSTTTTMPDDMPFYCYDGQPDAITRDASGRILVFKDDLYWEVKWSEVGLEHEPRPIAVDWAPATGPLDTALFVPSYCFEENQCTAPSYTYLFKGNKFWQFLGNQYIREFDLSQTLNGVPLNPDAALMYPGTSNIYFIKGDVYYRLTPDYSEVAAGYPRSMAVWWPYSSSFPTNIATAFIAPNDKLYFFEDNQYWRFNTRKFKTGNSYPRSTGLNWYGCTNNLQAANLAEMEDEEDEQVYDPNNPSNLIVIRVEDDDVSAAASLSTHLWPIAMAAAFLVLLTPRWL